MLQKRDVSHQQYTAKPAEPTASRLCPVRMWREISATRMMSWTQHAATSP